MIWNIFFDIVIIMIIYSQNTHSHETSKIVFTFIKILCLFLITAFDNRLLCFNIIIQYLMSETYFGNQFTHFMFRNSMFFHSIESAMSYVITSIYCFVWFLQKWNAEFNRTMISPMKWQWWKGLQNNGCRLVLRIQNS